MPKMKTNSGAKKKVCPYRTRKNQKKTRFQKSHSDQEDEKTEKKLDSFRTRRSCRQEECKRVAHFEITIFSVTYSS